MSAQAASTAKFSQLIFKLLSSMEFAITMLVTLAISSIIGTVLQQSQAYPDYMLKFGPFWFKVFEKLGLYDVYSSPWFLIILLLLLVSTTICVTRNGPSMIKDMRSFKTDIQLQSLRAMKHNAQWQQVAPLQATATQFAETLSEQGFRQRTVTKGDAILVTAKRGSFNRLGYILTHAAIVIICLGGLIDSNIPVKIAEWQGLVKIETKNIPLNQVPAKSRLAIGPQAFRGNITIPEGNHTNVVYLAVRDGYLVQQLPFRIQLNAFRIAYYSTGQPKLFESDITITAPDLKKPITTTLSVNHPFTYKGYTIYQSSFGDGGSHLNMQAWPLYAKNMAPIPLQGKVFENKKLLWGDKNWQLELAGFRQYNIDSDPTKANPKNVRNFGPSFQFKWRKPTGEAKEYTVYMNPITRNGREFLLSGVRSTPAAPYFYLFIPLDQDDSINSFYTFYKKLHNKTAIDNAINEIKQQIIKSLPGADTPALNASLNQTLTSLVNMFVEGGYPKMQDFIESSLPKSEKSKLAPAYLSMLRQVLYQVYTDNLPKNQPFTAQQANFLQDSVDAIGSLPAYGAPVLLTLDDFKQVYASGLQVTHSPGQVVLLLGCLFLIVGVFLLFYLPQQRLWLWLENHGDNNLHIDMAGMSSRNTLEFNEIFTTARDALTGNSDKK